MINAEITDNLGASKRFGRHAYFVFLVLQYLICESIYDCEKCCILHF